MKNQKYSPKMSYKESKKPLLPEPTCQFQETPFSITLQLIHSMAKHLITLNERGRRRGGKETPCKKKKRNQILLAN